MSNIDTATSKFLQERTNVLERRKAWTASVKPTLKETLNQYSKKYSAVGWYVHEYIQKNHDSIYLAVGNVPSGITDSEGKILMLMGGALHFSQTHNGKIRIWMEYPYIQDIAYHNPDHEVFEDVEPKNLTLGEIENLVIMFLERQLEGTLHEQRRPIGYN